MMSESTNEQARYEAAKAALEQARDAFMALEGNDRKKVIKEVFGITDTFSVIRIIKDFLR